MGAIGLATARDLQHRWRRLVVVALIVGVAGTITLAMAAGARRTSTALDRFKQQALSADIELAASPPTAAQMDELAHADGVAAVSEMQAFGLIIPSAPDFQSIGAPMDTNFGTVVDRDRLVAGRSPDPDAPNEVTIGEGLADRLGLGAGDHLVVESFTPDQIAAILQGTPDVGPRAGPQIPLEIVGIVRRPLDLGDQLSPGGLLVLTPAFARTYQDEVGVFGRRIRIRTEAGAPDVGRVVDESRRILRDLFVAQDLTVDTQGAQDAIRAVSMALWVGTAVAALAGLVTIALVLSREISLVGIDLATMRYLGSDRRQLVAIAALPGLLAAGVGALLAALGAGLASPLFPIGVARKAESAPGLRADWLVLALGPSVVAASTGAIALVVAHRATRPGEPGATQLRPSRPSTLAGWAAAAGLRPPLTSGVRLALERRGGGMPAAVPVRTAVAAAVLGVVGVAGGLVFASSLHHLVESPVRYGADWEVKTTDITSNTPCGATDYGLAGSSDLTALAEVCVQNVELDGRPVAGVAFTQLRGDSISPVVRVGRPPMGPGEVALGGATLRRLGKHVGDEITASGRHTQSDYRIVGQAVIPTFVQTQPLDDGAVFTGQGYAQLYDQNLFTRHFVARLDPAADRAAVLARIDAIPQLALTGGPSVPTAVDRVREIDWLPLTLAAVLGGLALLAVAHALVTTVRRRRHELAVLRTLGFDGGQVRATVAWHATTVAVAGLLVGMPLGALAGALAWRLVADGLGVVATADVPVLALAAAAACAVALCNVVAYIPGRIAAAGRPALALRSE